MKNRIKNRAGYSLVELVIVVTIIGILATIAIPNYRNYIDKAKMVTIYATIHQIMLAQEAYWTDFERFFPVGEGSDTGTISNTGRTLTIADTDLKISIPHGQKWTITASGKKNEPLKIYTVFIEPHFSYDPDRNFYYSHSVSCAGSVTVSDIPNLQ